MSLLKLYKSPDRRTKVEEPPALVEEDDEDDKLSVGSRNDPDPDDEDAVAKHDDIKKPADVKNGGEYPGFGAIVKLFEAIQKLTTEAGVKKGNVNQSKSDVVKQFFTKWRDTTGNDLYPLIRLLLPDRDNRRRTYMLKEAKLAKAIILAEGVQETNPDAAALLNWKVPSKAQKGGDFALAVYDFIKNRTNVSDTVMKVDELNEWLDQLSAAGHDAGKQNANRKPSNEHAKLLRQALKKISASDFKWVVRIILKDLRISIGEGLVLNCLHPEAMTLFNTCSDLLKVCWTLYDDKKQLAHDDSKIKIGLAFRPMLCDRNERDLGDILKKMRAMNAPQGTPSLPDPAFEFESKEFLLEEKLDGERIQLHKQGNKFWYYSRQATDYTYLYGATPNEGSLTPYIVDLFSDEYEQIVLDGEMLVWDPEMSKYIPFGSLKTYAKQTGIGDDEPRPCFKVFDLLLIKEVGKAPMCLIDAPLKIRRFLLSKVLTPKLGRLELLENCKITKSDDIVHKLGKIIESKGEGVVIKHPMSTYVLGVREKTWIKVKPDYMDSLGEEVKAVVIGGYWGKGSRGGRLASFLVGLKDSNGQTFDGEPLMFSFAKVGSGFNAMTYDMIQKMTKGKWFEYRKGATRNPPAWFKTISEWPDVLIRPSESFRVKIKAAEIVQGTEFATAKTLRFPRCIWVFNDEADPLESAMTMDDLTSMQGRQKRNHNGTMTTTSKRLKGKSGQVKALGSVVKPRLAGERGRVFPGLTFYVVDDDYKAEIEGLIDELGGSRIQGRVPDEGGIYISETFEPRKGLANKSKWGIAEKDVLKPSWVRECAKAGRMVPKTARHYSKVTDETKALDEYNLIEQDNGSDGHVQDSESQATDDTDIDQVQFERKPPKPKKSPPTPKAEQDKTVAPLPAQEINMLSEPPTESETDGEDEIDPTSLTDARPGMGAGLGQAYFDNERPCKPFVAYFDTSTNAERNSLPSAETASKEKQAQMDLELERAREVFIKHGGQATDDLTEATLTTIVTHKHMQDRVAEITKRTKRPRHRKVETLDWVQGLLDQAGHE